MTVGRRHKTADAREVTLVDNASKIVVWPRLGAVVLLDGLVIGQYMY